MNINTTVKSGKIRQASNVHIIIAIIGSIHNMYMYNMQYSLYAHIHVYIILYMYIFVYIVCYQ